MSQNADQGSAPWPTFKRRSHLKVDEQVCQEQCESERAKTRAIFSQSCLIRPRIRFRFAGERTFPPERTAPSHKIETLQAGGVVRTPVLFFALPYLLAPRAGWSDALRSITESYHSPSCLIDSGYLAPCSRSSSPIALLTSIGPW